MSDVVGQELIIVNLVYVESVYEKWQATERFQALQRLAGRKGISMVMTDPIADMLTRVRNAYRAAHKFVDMPSSKLKEDIAKILEQEGYISSFEVKKLDAKPTLKIELSYGQDKRRALSGIKRISTPGRRVYAKKDQIPRVLGGLGIAILSTSRGLMTDKKAGKENIGGEVICYVW